MKSKGKGKRIQRAYEVYAAIIKSSAGEVKTYLEDTRELDGKFPDGMFLRKMTPYEKMVTDGFEGNHYQVYLEMLEDTVIGRLEDLTTGGDALTPTGVKVLTKKQGEADIKMCRDYAIASTCKRLLPGFDELFEPKKVDFWGRCIPTPTPGSGKRRK